MSPDDLKKKASALPRTPGVYLMKNARGVVLYVGKANALRDRVGSYFQEGRSGERLQIAAMMPQVADFEVIPAESEVDALLMEARLIKDLQPKYNADLRDSKLYPYLEITRGDDFPRVFVTRQRDNRKSKYYGPFTDARGLRHAVQLLQRVFKFCTCSRPIRADDPKRRFERPCLLYHLKRCTAPCADRVSREEYLKQIELLRRFLDGKRKRVLRDLQARMEESSKRLEFEKAAQARDQIRAFEALGKRGSFDFFPEATLPPEMDAAKGLEELQKVLELPALPRAIEGVDISTLGGSDSVASVVTFVDGRPFKSGYRRFRIKTVEGLNDFAMMGEVVGRRFRRLAEEQSPLPDILLIDGGKGQLEAATEALKGVGVRPACIVALAKREELLYFGAPPRELKLRRNNPALQILQYVRDEAHRFAVHYHHILRGKRFRAER